MTNENAAESAEALLQAFAQTDYRVHLNGRDGIVRVGQRHLWLDQWLEGRGWTIITAYNPGGLRAKDADNAERHRQLLEHPALAGRHTASARNHDPRGHWPDEPGCLVADLDATERARLAHAFRQAAVVCGEPNDMARLELHGGGWPRRLPDWARRRD